MQERQKQLIKHIVEEYIKTAQPVGSNLLVNKYFKNISSATIRNEMAELERQDLITQPHTSAGRIPTEAGYKFYLENFVSGTQLKEVRELKSLKQEKEIAKKIAELSNSAVIISFSKDNIYYTGISNIFSQPEFHEYNLAYNFTNVIDHLDQVISKIYDQVSNDIEVKIGRENPFDPGCSSITTKTKTKMLTILGPMRMDYQKNINLIRYAREII